MRRGIRLAVDVGAVRIGVAASDPDGVLAVPVETVARGAGDIDRLVALATEREVLEVIVGWPVRLDGTQGLAVESVSAFASGLATALAPIPVRVVDERLTTASAQRSLTAAGKTVRKSRAVIDQAAAVEILTTALDRERATGEPAGHLLLDGAS